MRPVNQFPWSLNDMKRSPLASRRIPDSPPKPEKGDVRTSPLQYSSAPNRTRVWSFRSNEAIDLALTSIDTGDGTISSGKAGERVAICGQARSDAAMVESPTAADLRKRRREKAACSAAIGLIASLMQAPSRSVVGGRGPMSLAEEFGELFGDGAAELFGIDDGDGTTIVAGDVVTDADGDQLDRRTGLDLLDDMAQMPLQVVAGIDRQRRIVDQRAVRNHHQDLALLLAAEKALVRPVQRFAVDVFLQEALAHHQAQLLACPPPWRVGRFVDDVAKIVEPAGIGRLAGRKPGLARLPALPGAGRETENLHFDAATFQRARQDIRAGRSHRDGPPAHRTRIIQEQRHHGVAEGRFLFAHEGKRMIG